MEITDLVNHPNFSLASFFVAILALFSTYFFYRKSLKEKIPRLAFINQSLVEGLEKQDNNIQVLYKNEIQTRITVTKLIFWNHGKETIHKNDIVSLDPLRVTLKDESNIEILDSKVVKTSQDSINLKLELMDNDEGINAIKLLFDYLDHDDYAVIQIIHNGSINTKVSLWGKIKGVSPIKMKAEKLLNDIFLNVLKISEDFFSPNYFVNNPKFARLVLIAAYLFMSVIGVLIIYKGGDELELFGYILSLVGFLLAIIVYYLTRSPCPINFEDI